jgi:ketosteroid isomerase-like protein
MTSSERSEETAVRAVLEAYADAVFRGDADTLSRLFHPRAVMNGYLGDHLHLGGPELFLDDIRSHPPMSQTAPHFKTTWSAVHISGRTATATLHEDGFFGEGKFVNYFHLLKVDGQWKMMSKLFESL